MALDSYSPYCDLIDNEAGRPSLFVGGEPHPDLGLLESLLARAAVEGKSAQSGNVAKALDVWVAEQLRCAGFPEASIWPRRVMPRAMDPSILSFIQKLPPSLAECCCDELPERFRSVQVSVMGAAYPKQVDVGMASWPSGPEILISTKTMGSSFGKNMANRFEEAYGDAKNLKSRHPFAAIGFVFLVHAAILEERSNYQKAISMLEKLRAEDDVYDSVCLIVAKWDASGAKLVSEEFAGVPGILSCAGFYSEIVRLTLKHAAPEAYQAVREQMGEIL